MNDVSLEDFQKRVNRDRTRYSAIVAWHLQAFSTAGLSLPYTPDTTYVRVDFSNPKYTDYRKPAPTEEDPDATEYCWETELDEEKILNFLKKVVKFAREMGYAVEKDYTDDFTVKVSVPFGDDESTVIRYYTDREAVCTKKVIGTKVIPATVYPERIEEIVEWDCQKIALTA